MPEMFGGVEEVFAPGIKHAEDERRRLEHTRVQEDDHGSGSGPVDLDSGHVVIVPGLPPAVLPPRPRVEESETEQGEV
ncbi:DUF6191 domain-containing protein [Streptomyces sp. 549]|uniref:DUF6191 domain-containing protein n=1 Tax=Streptomyces sp. 549 TaxID=3049076 RepID=UPI0024C3139D|nr:DUF6191 domain-containing protein [Streptomyces sp. 549]MDK1476078.1 DUF6191 domain-containing protein [Streptomyces sp. 549]